jgi:hypothetical protein
LIEKKPVLHPVVKNLFVNIRLSLLILFSLGAIAQMGERLHGMQEVVGSNPIGSIFYLLVSHKLVRNHSRAISPDVRQTRESMKEDGFSEKQLKEPSIKHAVIVNFKNDTGENTVEVTAEGKKHHKMAGKERAMLYMLAINTGLRANEVASLTWQSFRLDSPTPTVTVLGAALDLLPKLPSLSGNRNDENKVAALKTGTDDMFVGIDKIAYKPAYKKLTENAFPDTNHSLPVGTTKVQHTQGEAESNDSDKAFLVKQLGVNSNLMSLTGNPKKENWAGLESNQRRLAPMGLQPIPFSRSGTDPLFHNGCRLVYSLFVCPARKFSFWSRPA